MGGQPRYCALVTGASDGIGAEFARVFAANGHHVVIVARRKARLEKLADEIVLIGAPRPTVIALDLAQPDAGESLAKELINARLPVRYLVNNAGFGLMGRAVDLHRAEQLAMIDLNIRTLTSLTLRFLPDIIAAKGGIMNVASIASFMPGPGLAVYYASKAYVRSFTEALREETKGAGIKVSCLCPGPVETGFQSRSGFHFEGLMGALKPARLQASDVAQQAYDGLMANKRIVMPGFVNKLLVWSARATPNAILSPILAAAQQRRPTRHTADAPSVVPEPSAAE